MTETAYVSADIIGGLGNHLFIIAMLLSYVKKTKKKLIFKNEHNLYNQYNLPRKTFWNTLFKGQFDVMEPEYFNLIKFNTYMEDNSYICKPFPVTNSNTFFKGYFQSFKYVDDKIRDEMIHHIYSNADIMTKAYNLYNEIMTSFGSLVTDDDMVSVHIRRTDYIFSQDFHHNLDANYYKEALKTVDRKNVVVFSDDIDWCKSSINKSWYDYNNIYFVDINDVETEFILMSMFKHNIIANSTFSLWASFISTYDTPKIIIAPKQWFNERHNIDHSEIYHKYITNVI